ncbi:MAG: hypothetical protein JO031_15595 [Ktedonobacteraceae bacterium]|nr:hypothetical protein [Ktedonobacteraceae bacterium]
MAQQTGTVMGQYSQWLYHREVDQQLRERLEFLEQELHNLQEQAAQLEDAASYTENPILQAIAMQQSAEVLLEDTPPLSSQQELSPEHTGSEEASKSFSSALFAWSHLPNLHAQKMQTPTPQPGRQESEAQRSAPTPHPEVNLLPADMATFIDTHEQTLPQLQTPRWLRNAQYAAQISDEQNFAPSEPDERTDASIRRWLERWGKQLPDSPPAS